jgi:hypothetical protein
MLHITGEKLHRHSKQDDAEHLLQHCDAPCTKDALNGLGASQHKIDNDDVDDNGYKDVRQIEFSTDGNEGGHASSPCDQWESQWHDGGHIGMERVIFSEELHPENHLQSDKKDYQGTRHSKGIHIDSDEVDDALSHKEEAHHDEQGDDTGLLRIDLSAFLLEVQDDGHIADDVDDREEDQAGS